ncbi:helix-turn-helix domain-containing protein [Boseongicola aestuarii]|jgi:DNA-binding protein Fis|uniref:Global DNA-binding transcriptional dual regulator Fis n=1 Tax=Boseongicola aestuarii TaxID=1470561 RepID=A0A238J3H7_9RHOB|nr:helix-turn-helix domain-containing protein [Boseongicola aestuarii]SMX25289.1 global DNA-binding transcriptional dual regulator Fis [Boseongicola aestuarii]
MLGKEGCGTAAIECSVNTTIVHNYFETNIVVSDRGNVLSSQTILKKVIVDDSQEQDVPDIEKGTSLSGPRTLSGPAFSIVLEEKISKEKSSEAGLQNSFDISKIIAQIGRKSLRELSDEVRNEVEKVCIKSAIQTCRGNKVLAANLLGVSRQTLYQKLRKFMK